MSAFGAAAALGKAEPIDNLICVPQSEIVRTPDGIRHPNFAAEPLANGDPTAKVNILSASIASIVFVS